MGRKPNAIVTEFFNRGAKLHDSSNRYEHTCKLCGQNFPKGRSDSLLGHLTKTCPAISAQDRARVQSIWPGTSDRASKRSRNNAGHAVPVFQGPGGQFVSRQKLGGFNGAVGGLHGLNVLAEASRQVGAAAGGQQQQDFQTQQLPGQTPEEQLSAAQASNIALVDPALEASNKHDAEQNGDVKLDLNESHAYFADADGTVLGAFTTSEGLSSAVSETTSDNRQTSQLSLIAASANEMVHQDSMPPLEPDVQLLLYRDSLNNPFLQSPPTSQAILPPQPGPAITNDGISPVQAEEVVVTEQPPQSQTQSQTQSPAQPSPDIEQPSEQAPCGDLQASDVTTLDSATQRAALYPRPIAIQPSPAGTPVPSLPDRAMMLTKAKGRSQFSEERRREVQLVRQLGACLRCRMLKKTSTLAWQGLVDLERQTGLEMYPGRIEACHFDSDPSKYLTFSTFMGLIQDTDVTSKTESSDFPSNVRSVYMINTEVDSVESKLDQYIKSMAFFFYETEPSHVIKSTLLAASQLSEKTEGGDELLDGVLQLWIATRIITDPNFRWKLFINSSLSTSSLQPFATITNDSGIPLTDASDPESYSMITTQLRAGAEKCAEKLSKGVLNKIEQRLLQKQRAGQF
ncbi:60S ribosomal protein L35, partial [Ascosphaera pollenicola]